MGGIIAALIAMASHEFENSGLESLDYINYEDIEPRWLLIALIIALAIIAIMIWSCR